MADLGLERELLRALLEDRDGGQGEPLPQGIEAADTRRLEMLESFVARGRASRCGRSYHLNEGQAALARTRLRTIET